jgi:hypothetical protein
MKFSLTFKTPDVLDDLHNSITDADLVDNQEQAEQWQARIDFAEQYVKHGEYLTVEFDTEAKTATVVKVRKR